MKYRYYAILGLLFLASLTACAGDGMEVENYYDPEADACFVEMHINEGMNPDEDYKFAMPCVIVNEKVDAP
jgi:hypothetical protein